MTSKLTKLPLLLLLGALGCSSTPGLYSRTTTPARQLDLSKAWPSPTSSPFGTPYGGDVPLRHHAPRAVANLDLYLLPQRAQKPMPVIAPHYASAAKPAAEPVITAQLLPAAPSPIVTAPALPQARIVTSDDTQRYASREQSSRKQQAFRGGDVIVIGASTLVIVLLIVLLILLLR